MLMVRSLPLRAGCSLISPTEKELTTGLNCSWKKRHGGILKVKLNKKAGLTNEKSLLIFSLATSLTVRLMPEEMVFCRFDFPFFFKHIFHNASPHHSLGTCCKKHTSSVIMTVHNGLAYVISKKVQVKRITLHASQEYVTLISTSHNQLKDRHLFMQIVKSNPHYSSPTPVKREKILTFNNQICWHVW